MSSDSMRSTETIGEVDARRPRASLNIAAGTCLGPYRIEAPLALGGTRAVFRATDMRLERPVAIKVLWPSRALTVETARRLFREARAASALTHPNVVTIFDVGIAHAAGYAYIVMELVEGQRLDNLLAAGPLSMPRLLRLAVQIVQGLASAHARGVVHCDLKPTNIMVTPHDAIKLLDFGLASMRVLEEMTGRGRTSEPDRASMCAEGVIGTPGYMSPEQANGKIADFRSDQFSFGALLYEMVTQRRAFEASHRSPALAVAPSEQPEPLSRLNPHAPMELQRVIERCLATDPRERYSSTHDLQAALERISAGG